jgi:hypothetical protein
MSLLELKLIAYIPKNPGKQTEKGTLLRRFLVSLVLASLLVACGSAAPTTQPAGSSPASSAPATPAATARPALVDARIAPPGTRTQVIAPGERFERDGVAYAFIPIGADSTASPGEQVITLDIAIENISSAKRVNYIPIALSISDSDGYIYKPVESTSTLERTFVPVGQKIEQRATFHLPAAANGLLLTYTPQAATDDALFAVPLDNQSAAQITPIEGPHVADDGYAVTVVSVSRGDVQLHDGSVATNRLILEVAVDNESGNGALNVMPDYFRLKRTMNTNYPAEWLSGPRALEAAHLQPGMRVRGLIAFDVPADPAGYTLIYEPTMGTNFDMRLAVQE